MTEESKQNINGHYAASAVSGAPLTHSPSQSARHVTRTTRLVPTELVGGIDSQAAQP